MWLLNHTTARKFEVPMLKRIGIQEIFLPKKYPSHPSFRSASVDWVEDADLTIPMGDLAILNDADWYDDPGFEAWQVATRHFDLAFFTFWKGTFYRSLARRFGGAKVWRAYGLANHLTHDQLLTAMAGQGGPLWTANTASNLWFGQAYDHLADAEPPHIAERAVFLPAGLSDTAINDQWIGDDKRIFFVCPDLGFNPHYQRIYRNFRQTFAGLPYAVAGAQPVAVEDDHVLGFVSGDHHRENMRRFALMFCDTTEPNDIHYHAFEAVRVGTPLVFMAGGLLDRIGGIKLPGRCQTPQEARNKVTRILAGDRQLIGDIRRTQVRLLDTMKAEHCEPLWRAGLESILQRLVEARSISAARGKRIRRIAVIVPVGYRGGTLRGAKLLAQAIAIGSQEAGCPAEVVFGHLDEPTCYPDGEFTDLPEHIERRTYRWKIMSQEEASRACAYSGVEVSLYNPTYIVPDDGMNQFLDCDLWLIVSDRLNRPLLPVRPYLLMVYDYLQRYVSILDEGNSQQFISCAHAAEAILVSTEFTAADARQYAGIPAERVKKVPLLAPDFAPERTTPQVDLVPRRYFIWTTNLALHKNHENALKALRLYYERYDGTLECRVTGVETMELFKRDLLHLKPLSELRRASKAIKKRLVVEGELADRSYRQMLQKAAFLWHPGRIDNGTFSVIEAACVGVPSLSSDYPAMREIDRQFHLNLTWFDPNDPEDMARKLKEMETDYERARSTLPSQEVFADQSVQRLAGGYWKVIREYL
jgi:glycosyltransferase involved in cell wall biosynthesis